MIRLPSVRMVLGQLFKKPATNLFPAKNLPPSITAYLDAVAAGTATINPPITTPPRFRGKITYDRDTCIGCKMCIRVCPANAIEFLPDTKRVRIWVTQCVFCSQCNEVCPKDCLQMSSEFLLATEDRYAENMIVE
ncbi:MAG TPA: 4Fe-4S binding protein [Methanospirillum sp.]|nr:4Fe-4S binding protein [Methanospirillum sp.]